MTNHPNRSRRDKIERARRKLADIRDWIPPEAAGLRPQRGLAPEYVEELRSRICAVINDLDLVSEP